MVNMFESLKLVSEYGEVRYAANIDGAIRLFRETEFEYYVESSRKVGLVLTVNEEDLDTEVNEIEFMLISKAFEMLYNQSFTFFRKWYFKKLWNWTTRG